MNEQSSTTFESKTNILAELWLNYRNDPEFTDFVSYNDLGLPLAYVISEGIVSNTPIAENLVSETFTLLLAGLEIDDTGFENLDEILTAGEFDI